MNDAPRLFKVGEILAAFALVFGICGALSSLPPFETGHWEKAEPIIITMMMVAALAFSTLTILAWTDRDLLNALLGHPVVVLPVVVALWSLVAIPLATHPLAVIFGPPQSGQGTIWFLALGALTACARLLRCNEGLWLAVSVATIAAALVTAILNLFPFLGLPRLLLTVSGYYGYLALALPLLALPLQGARRRWIAVLSGVATLAVLAGARNASAASAVVLGGAVTVLLFLLRRHGGGPILERWLGAGLAVLAAVIPYSIFRWTDWVSSFPSLFSRQLTMRVATAASDGSLAHVLFGYGLGQTQDALFRGVSAAGARLWDPEWDFFWRDYYHSHNWLTEAFLTLGVPGVVLSLLCFLAPTLWVDSRMRPFAAGFSVAAAFLDGLWMPLAFYLPCLALAWAALTEPASATRGATSERPLRGTFAIPVLLGLLAFFAAGSSGIHIADARRIAEVQNQLLSVGGTPANDDLSFPSTLQGSHQALAEITRTALDELRQLPPEALDDSARGRFDWIFRKLSETIPTTRTPALAMTGLSLFAMTDVTGELASFAASDDERDRLWERWLDRLLLLAPQRSDAAIPYLTHLLVRKQSNYVTAYAQRLLKDRPGDPVGLYFLGVALTGDPNPARKAEGMRYIGLAVSAGLEQFMPVPDWLKQEASAYAPTGARK
jgi:hypothetical protein